MRQVWSRFLQWLDAHRVPQRLVGVLRRRARLSGSHGGVHAVGLSVSNPLLSTQALLADFVPRSFGGWRDYRVLQRLVGEFQVVAILRDPKSGVEMSMVMPRHRRFPVQRFHHTRQVRLTREGIRSGLVSVRDAQGLLLAVGVLEAQERAGFSYRWAPSP